MSMLDDTVRAVIPHMIDASGKMVRNQNHGWRYQGAGVALSVITVLSRFMASEPVVGPSC
ncbi:hypothetical protein MARHY1516 [Marinobacter nauticus ATCC 49840]|nr:hypothetical protein MARHY1516 [Marinobacter nauticus ATCC 49840]